MRIQRLRKIVFSSALGSGSLLVAAFGMGSLSLHAQRDQKERPAWLASVYAHVMHAPLPTMRTGDGQVRTILPYQLDADASGIEGTVSNNGVVPPGSNPFFQSLGSNGRSCATCHQPATGMSLSLDAIQSRYRATGGFDPLFAPVDGANCPDSVLKHGAGRSISDEKNPHSLLLNRGVFRVALPWPPKGVTPEFAIEVLNDPAGCENNSVYGLSSSNPMISVYRRPLMASNLKYITTPGIGLSTKDPRTGLPMPIDFYTGESQTGNIMFDGREPSLQSQAFDATMTHAQAKEAPSDEVVQKIVDFENGLFSAQIFDNKAGVLTADGAFGGPAAMASQHAGLIAAPATFSEYASWANLSFSAERRAQRESVARGEAIFSSRTFLISNVAGLNDVPVIGNNLHGTCASCHNTTDSGNDIFVMSQRDIGVSGDHPAAYLAPDLPLFRLTCVAGKTTSFHGSSVVVRDPGRALLTGKCSDIGKLKAPQLRALPARAPYFHDGSARSLREVVEFYNQRFSIQFSDQEKEDLINFLGTL